MALTYDAIGDYWRSTSWTKITAVPLTVHAWAKTNNNTVGQIATIIQDDSAANEQFRLSMNASGQACSRARSVASGINQACYTVSGMSNGVWHSLAGLHASVASVFAFLDGNKSTEATTSTTPINIDSLQISGFSGANSIWDGDLCEVAWWNRILADEEVTGLAKKFSALFYPEGLVFYHPARHANELVDYYGLTLSKTGTPAKADHPAIIYPTDMPPFVPPPSGVSPPPAPGPPLRAIRRRRIVVGAGR